MAFFCAFALSGCVDSPEAALGDLQAAARSGNAAAMYPRLTSRSIALVQAAVQMGGKDGPLAFKQSAAPVELVSAHHQKDNSVLVVKESGISYVIPFVRESGRWKADLFLMTGFLDGDRIPNFPRGGSTP